jgi:hypothetical protein
MRSVLRPRLDRGPKSGKLESRVERYGTRGRRANPVDIRTKELFKTAADVIDDVDMGLMD